MAAIQSTFPGGELWEPASRRPPAHQPPCGGCGGVGLAGVGDPVVLAVVKEALSLWSLLWSLWSLITAKR